MKHLRKILSALERDGFLLEADADLPSVATMVAGESIRGSWWGHEAGTAIYNTCEALTDRDDVLRIKLLKGKVTYVHAALWPALAKVASSKAGWQMDALSASAGKLLAFVEKREKARADEEPGGLDPKSARAAIKELEERLLVLTSSIHTDSGAHVKGVESWQSWMQRIGLRALGNDYR